MGRSKIFDFSGNNWSCPPAISCGLEVIICGNEFENSRFIPNSKTKREAWKRHGTTIPCTSLPPFFHHHIIIYNLWNIESERKRENPESNLIPGPNFLNKSQNSEPSISCSKTLESSQKGKGKKKRKKEMGYPKVKVRQQEDQDDHQPLTDFCFPEKEHEETPPTVVRIPESYVPSVVIPSISATEGEMKDNKVEEEIKQNIRASSIPRPRAVLSSPVNDTAIGSKNRIKAVRTPALKNHNLVKNNHTQSVPSHTTENSKKAIKSKGASEGNSLKGRKGSETTLPSQRQPPRTGKPSSVGRQVSFSLD
ncbi:hypothetical protein EV1_022242 [Malus domestica]